MIGLVTRNIGWKLLSLLLAILLWFVIVRDPELATVIPAPVLYRGMPEEFVINTDLVQNVRLEIRGPSGQLTPDSLTGAMVILDLGNVEEPGDRTYMIRSSNVSLPRGVVLSRAVPSQIRVRFERRATREMPVRVRFSAPPPEGYEVEQVVATPPELSVIGPEGNVADLEYVETDSIDLSEVVGASEFQVNCHVSDPQVGFESSPVVSVRVDVKKSQD